MTDKEYLQRAIEISEKSAPVATAYRVGAVVVTPRDEVFEGYTHETDPTNHAEEEAIIKAGGVDLRGSTMYASMEPCSTRASKPRSCSALIMDHGFARVVFALKEPAHFVRCTGAADLAAAGIEVVEMSELAPKVKQINRHILNE